MRTVPVVLEIAERAQALARRREPGSSTSRTRSASSLAPSSTPATAPSACATSRSAPASIRRLARRGTRARGRRPGRAQPPHVGAARAARRRRRAARPCWPTHGDELAGEIELPRRLLDELGVVPSYYLRYFYAHDSVLREQLEGEPRAAVVRDRAKSPRPLPRPGRRRAARPPHEARRRVLQ